VSPRFDGAVLDDDGDEEEEETSVPKANAATSAAKRLIDSVGVPTLAFPADSGDILVLGDPVVKGGGPKKMARAAAALLPLPPFISHHKHFFRPFS
jgi:hypothetical protein